MIIRSLKTGDTPSKGNGEYQLLVSFLLLFLLDSYLSAICSRMGSHHDVSVKSETEHKGYHLVGNSKLQTCE